MDLLNAEMSANTPITADEAETFFTSKEYFLNKYYSSKKKEVYINLYNQDKTKAHVIVYDDWLNILSRGNPIELSCFEAIKDFVDKLNIEIKKDSKVYNVSIYGKGNCYVIISDEIDYVISTSIEYIMPVLDIWTDKAITFDYDINKIAWINSHIEVLDGWTLMYPKEAAEAMRIYHSRSDFNHREFEDAYKKAYGMDLAAGADKKEKDSKVN